MIFEASLWWHGPCLWASLLSPVRGRRRGGYTHCTIGLMLLKILIHRDEKQGMKKSEKDFGTEKLSFLWLSRVILFGGYLYEKRYIKRWRGNNCGKGTGNSVSTRRTLKPIAWLNEYNACKLTFYLVGYFSFGLCRWVCVIIVFLAYILL